MLEAKLVDGRGLMATMIGVDCDNPAATILSELPKRAPGSLRADSRLHPRLHGYRGRDAAVRLLEHRNQLEEMTARLREVRVYLAVATRSTRITKPRRTFAMSMSVASLMAAAAAEPPPTVLAARKIELGRTGLSGLPAGKLASRPASNMPVLPNSSREDGTPCRGGDFSAGPGALLSGEPPPERAGAARARGHR